MELRNLRHFSALAETLNYRVAAERLYLTQSALTRSIAALERELGVRLFDRDKRHVSLTAEGTELLERVHEVLSDAGRLATWRAPSGPGSGTRCGWPSTGSLWPN